MELSDTEKERIRLEETYRADVRQTLAARDDRKAGVVLAFLNTTLGIWLLSTLVVGIGGTLYTNAQAERARAAQVEQEERQRRVARDDRIRLLDTEVAYRLSAIQSFLRARDREQVEAARSGVATPVTPADLTALVLASDADDKRALFQEFRATPLIGLLSELALLIRADRHETRQTTHSDSASSTADVTANTTPAASSSTPVRDAAPEGNTPGADVENAITTLSDLDDFFATYGLAASPGNARAVASAINEHVFSPRWRLAFNHLRCEPAEPFC